MEKIIDSSHNSHLFALKPAIEAVLFSIMRKKSKNSDNDEVNYKILTELILKLKTKNKEDFLYKLLSLQHEYSIKFLTPFVRKYGLTDSKLKELGIPDKFKNEALFLIRKTDFYEGFDGFMIKSSRFNNIFDKNLSSMYKYIQGFIYLIENYYQKGKQVSDFIYSSELKSIEHKENSRYDPGKYKLCHPVCKDNSEQPKMDDLIEEIFAGGINSNILTLRFVNDNRLTLTLRLPKVDNKNAFYFLTTYSKCSLITYFFNIINKIYDITDLKPTLEMGINAQDLNQINVI